jgi:hypothetical protein
MLTIGIPEFRNVDGINGKIGLEEREVMLTVRFFFLDLL